MSGLRSPERVYLGCTGLRRQIPEFERNLKETKIMVHEVFSAFLCVKEI